MVLGTKIGQREYTMWGVQTDGEDNIGSVHTNTTNLQMFYIVLTVAVVTLHFNNGSDQLHLQQIDQQFGVQEILQVWH